MAYKRHTMSDRMRYNISDIEMTSEMLLTTRTVIAAKWKSLKMHLRPKRIVTPSKFSPAEQLNKPVFKAFLGRHKLSPRWSPCGAGRLNSAKNTSGKAGSPWFYSITEHASLQNRGQAQTCRGVQVGFR